MWEIFKDGVMAQSHAEFRSLGGQPFVIYSVSSEIRRFVRHKGRTPH